MELTKLMITLLTTLFDKKEDEIETMLFEGEGDEKRLKEKALDPILEMNKAKIQAFKEEKTKAFDNGFKKAEKEFKGLAEKKFIELTGFNPEKEDAGIDEMIPSWLEAQKKVKPGEITDDIIKKHPVYLALEKNSIPKPEHEKVVNDFESFKKNVEKSQTISGVKSKAWDIVQKMNPILSENQVIAQNRKNDFLSKLESYDFQSDKDDILILKDGQRVEDEHGNRLDFDKFIGNLASQNFDFKAPESENTGNKNKDGKPVVISERPTTSRELNAVLDKYTGNDEESMKKRIALTKYYDEHRKD